MTEDVNPPSSGKPSLRQAQTALTEERIIAAAGELFLAGGYVATTLEAVARRAGVGARTVYVRFGTKAALIKRVVDVAIVGDTAAVDVLGREPMRQALAAPSAGERITMTAALGRAIMERAGGLFAVAKQAAAVEPVIEEFWQQGRAQARYTQRVFWTQMATDGLLPGGTDLDWLIDTAAVMTGPETYLLVIAMLGWDLDSYQRWLEVTLTRLAGLG